MAGSGILRDGSGVRAWLAAALLAGAALGAVGCAPDVDFEVTRRRERPGQAGTAAAGADGELEPARELALLTWNIEWFQDPTRGPADDERQFRQAREVLAQARADLAGLQEIADPDRLYELMAALPEHAVVISDYAWPQQTALLYRRERFELIAFELVTGLDDAGRPPLAVTLRAARLPRLLVVVVHAKAGRDAGSRARRERFATGLKAWLDARPAGTPAIVLGDFNDTFRDAIDGSGRSPYAPFAPGSGYTPSTAPLEAGAEPSTVWGRTVDHVVLSDDLAAGVVPGSANVLRDELLAAEPAFFDVVSDHAPVTLRLRVR